MELVGMLDQQNYKINVNKKSERLFVVSIEDREFEIDITQPLPNLYSMLNGDASYEIRVNNLKQAGRYEVQFYSEAYNVNIASPLELLLADAGGGKQGEAALEAGMPGQVQRLLVKEGDQVEEDQGLVVLVAMKMENELGSPKAGVVKQILVKEGENVEGDAVLVVIA